MSDLRDLVEVVVSDVWMGVRLVLDLRILDLVPSPLQQMQAVHQ